MRISDWSSDVCSSDLMGAFVTAIIVTSAYGYSIERIAYRPLRGSNRLIPLISAIGMSIFLQNTVLLSQDSKDKSIPNLIPGNFTFGPGGAQEVLISYMQRSEEHTSELQSLMRISYAVFCLKKKTKQI